MTLDTLPTCPRCGNRSWTVSEWTTVSWEGLSGDTACPFGILDMVGVASSRIASCTVCEEASPDGTEDEVYWVADASIPPALRAAWDRRWRELGSEIPLPAEGANEMDHDGEDGPPVAVPSCPRCGGCSWRAARADDIEWVAVTDQATGSLGPIRCTSEERDVTFVCDLCEFDSWDAAGGEPARSLGVLFEWAWPLAPRCAVSTPAPVG